MNLQSDTPEYIEAFTHTLAAHGVPEETAGSLYHQARVGEALQDPWFREGFEDVLGEKRASFLPAVISKSVSAAPAAKKGIPRALKWGAGLLGLGTLGVGAPALAAGVTTGKNPWTARDRSLGELKTTTPSVPDWALKSQPSKPQGSSGNPFGYIDGFAVNPGSTSSTSTGPLAAARSSAEHLKALQKRYTDLTSRTPGEGLQGVLETRRTSREAKRVAKDIQRAQRTLVGDYYSGFQAPARRGLKSIQDVRGRLKGDLEKYQEQSDELAEYLRASQDNPWATPWNWMSRTDRRAEKLLGRTATLQDILKQLDEWEKNIRGGPAL